MTRLAVAGLAALAVLEWPSTEGLALGGDACDSLERCGTSDGTWWLLASRSVAVVLLAVLLGATLWRTASRPAGSGRLPRDWSWRVALPLAAAAVTVVVGWLALLTAVALSIAGSWVGACLAVGLGILGAVRTTEHLADSAWAGTRPRLAAQIAWVALVTAVLAALVSTVLSPDRVRARVVVVTVALAVCLAVAVSELLVRAGARSLLVPLALEGAVTSACLVVTGYFSLLFLGFVLEAFRPSTPSALPSVVTETAPPSAPPPRGGVGATYGTAPATGVPAARACAPSDLRLTGGGWDMTMGKSSMTVTAHNVSARACWLDGVARVRISQGASDLRLTYRVGSAEEIGRPGAPRRVGVPAGGTARAVLWWPGYRDAANQETPQRLWVTAAPGPEVEVPMGQGPAPFDLVDGGEVLVSVWAVKP